MGDKDFFLSPDDAQTMGDINYMRKAKRTRRTFPKTLKNKDGFAFENEVSSIEDRTKLFKSTSSSQSQPGITGGSIVNQTNDVQANGNGTQQSANVESFKAPEARRKQDSSMDMFRNMAKKIGRR